MITVGFVKILVCFSWLLVYFCVNCRDDPAIWAELIATQTTPGVSRTASIWASFLRVSCTMCQVHP